MVAPSGLVSLIGGKWTTSRLMAEDTINQAAMVGELPARPSPTKNLRLHGWCETSDDKLKLAEYGTDAKELLALCENAGDKLLHPRLPYRIGQVHWAVRQEMARTVEDVLSRRLRALPLDTQAAIEMAPQVEQIMAAELGRDEDWKKQQVSNFCELAQHYLFK